MSMLPYINGHYIILYVKYQHMDVSTQEYINAYKYQSM
jgi:hypothetical protein